MDPTLANYLDQWLTSYQLQLKKIPMFNGAAQSWNQAQKQSFIGWFYHVRGHFDEFLWFCGNFAPNLNIKEIIIDNVREEMGGAGISHEQLYYDYAISFGLDLTYERLEKNFYLPFLQDYNDFQMRALIAADWEQRLLMFAVSERLDQPDYAVLYDLAQDMGTQRRELAFFTLHVEAEHFDGPLLVVLDKIWREDPNKVKQLFDQAGDFQLSMWQRLDGHVSAVKH